MTLEEIVSAYIRDYRNGTREEMETFRLEKSRASAIRRAALCEFPDGKRHSHQYRIPRRLLDLAEERLQAVAGRLAAVSDFDALHEIVRGEIGSVSGIGKLMVYDIAHRIGAYLGKTPTLVYLHQGTKEGAAILGFRGDTLDPTVLPTAFSRLTPAEIEDCLCIYRDELRGESGGFCRDARCGVRKRHGHCVQ